LENCYAIYSNVQAAFLTLFASGDTGGSSVLLNRNKRLGLISYFFDGLILLLKLVVLIKQAK